MTNQLTKIELLEALEGAEIESSEFWTENGNLIGVLNGQIIQYGRMLAAKPTIKQLCTLFDDLCNQEGIFLTTNKEDMLS